MPDAYPPSEFGGKTNKLGNQPPVRPDGVAGHVNPSAGERLHNHYRTGFEEDTGQDVDPAFWEGMRPLAERVAEKAALDEEAGVEF